MSQRYLGNIKIVYLGREDNITVSRDCGNILTSVV